MTAPTDWIEVRKWAEAEIEALRDQLEASLDEVSTATARGRIIALRSLLERGKPKPAIPERQHRINLTAGPAGY